MTSQQNILNIGDRALVFGGAYGNLQATEAILAYADKHGFAPEQIIFTGDLVAYCGQPQETTDLIRQSGCHIIMGNCEESLASGSDDCGCGFEEDSACDLLSAQWFSYCQKALSPGTKQWMGSLPKELMISIGPFKLACFHGTQNAINEFVFPSDVAGDTFSIPQRSGIDGYLVGHSGIPFLAEQNSTLWINSGAAGMPANDGSSRVWFATLEWTDNRLEVQTHAIDYDYESAAKVMEAAGLNNGYRNCLSDGIWPSHDVLPDREREQTGLTLRPQKKTLEKAPFSAAI